jgi:hypothetical protein
MADVLSDMSWALKAYTVYEECWIGKVLKIYLSMHQELHHQTLYKAYDYFIKHAIAHTEQDFFCNDAYNHDPVVTTVQIMKPSSNIGLSYS